MDNYPLAGKSAVVTGATSGIGLQAAFLFARSGAFVMGIGRNAERCADAERMIRTACPSACVYFFTTDLALQSQVRRLAVDIRDQLFSREMACLDILVNNAGLYSGIYQRTTEGIELTLAVNHFAPFLLTHDLFHLLLAAGKPRVLTLSSHSHYLTWMNVERLVSPRVYFGLWAYKVSKLANVLFSAELNRRCRNTSLRAFAVDPGLVNTEIGMKETHGLSHLVWNARRKSGTSAEVPAHTILYLSSGASLQDTPDVYWKDCQPLKPSRQSLNPETARKLWQKSCEICGIEEEWQ